MNFFKQIAVEMKKMLSAKFILIFGALIFLFYTVALPILSYFFENREYDNYYYGYSENIVIGGTEYESNNQMVWELQYLVDNQSYFDQNLSGTALTYALDVSDELIAFYEKYIPYVVDDMDYRLRLSYDMAANVATLAVLNVSDLDIDAMQMAIQNGLYVNVNMEEINAMTEEEKALEATRLEGMIEDFDALMVNADFSKFVDITRAQYEEQIAENEARIEQLEQDIIEDPSQEENISSEINSLLSSNEAIIDTYIPELDYRLEHNIIYDDGSWQDEALKSRSDNERRIADADRYKETEESFYANPWMMEQYGTYAAYLDSIEKDKQTAQANLLVAQNSLDSGEPDMRFVEDGARTALFSTFGMNMIIMMFGVLIGGWVIASEFQSGTVRLLMIRPRTRLKVLFSKFFAGMLLLCILYAAILFVVGITQGFMKGFGDYFYPNYTASGDVNFFVMLFGSFLGVLTSVLFVYTFSFATSVVIRNIAVAIILPTLMVVGSSILMLYLTSRAPINILAFTPIPYLSIQDYFVTDDSYSYVSALLNKGMDVSVELGIAMLIVYTVIFAAICAVVFKKRDITN